MKKGGFTILTSRKTAESETVLTEIVTLMKDRSEWRFEVQGHTDNVGAAAVNRARSQQRAAAAVSWLRATGVDAAHLVAKGYGDTAAVAGTTTDEGRRTATSELKKLNQRTNRST